MLLKINTLSLLKYFILMFGVLRVDVTLAGVYRCVDENGVVEFRDRVCALTSEIDGFLPYVYKPTDPNVVLAKEETFHKTEKMTQKQLAEQKKKQERLVARQKKSAEKAAALADRRLLRCEKTKEKIKQIEAELRTGCKLRRSNTLKKQLMHAQKMQQRYCTAL